MRSDARVDAETAWRKGQASTDSDSRRRFSAGIRSVPAAGFVHEALRPEQAHGRFGLGGTLLHREEKNLGARSDAADLHGGFDAVHYRHMDVQKDQIGLQSFDAIEGLLAVLGLAADGEGVSVQKGTHGISSDVMVVHEQYSRRKSPAA